MACCNAWPGCALSYVITVGFQPSSLAASVKPGLSRAHDGLLQVRNATFRPFSGALGSFVNVEGIEVGSVAAAARIWLGVCSVEPARLGVTPVVGVLAAVSPEPLERQAT